MHDLRARPPPLTAQLSCGVLCTRAAPLMRLHSVPLAWPSCSRVYSRLPRAASLDWLCALHASLGSAHLCIAPVLIRARADPRFVAIPACTPNYHRSRADRPCSSRLASPRPFPLSCLCVALRSCRTCSCAAPMSLGRSAVHPFVSLHMPASLSSDVPPQCAARLARVPKPLDSRTHRAISVFSHRPRRPRPLASSRRSPRTHTAFSHLQCKCNNYFTRPPPSPHLRVPLWAT
jgi:hypothetical protein